MKIQFEVTDEQIKQLSEVNNFTIDETCKILENLQDELNDPKLFAIICEELGLFNY